MSPEELQAAEARITETETEIAALTSYEAACIEKAREYNLERKVTANKRTALTVAIAPLRSAVAAHYAAELAAKRQATSDKAKADAEAKANEPPARSPLEVLTEQVAKLTEMLAAKE